ncbi:MAG: choice-of-anchor Q domain-containing protein, partial [Solirubrobacterales bacterium]
MRFKGGLAIFVAAIALTPATASAAVRYTSPGGSGLACSQASPCSLLDALGVANSGDEIRLQAAEYDIAGSLPSITQLNLTISGPPGRYTPSEDIAFLRFTSTGDATRIQALNRNLTLRRLGVTGSSGNQFLIKASDSSGLTLDRVLVLDSGSFGSVYAQDATILNSVISQSNFLCTPAPTPCRATEVTGTISDSTIISAAELGTAISNDTNYHNSTFGDRCDLTVQNTLAVGRVYNLRTNRGSGACTPTVVYNYSWIPTSGTGGGISDPGGYAIPGLSNLPSAPAALTDPLGGNFTPAFGSPAINAGLDASSEDLYGRPRPIGIAHDIGAVEAILPPTVSTVSVGTVTSSSAPVSATVNP